jgi:putative addiction module component (TIGR02574 family)
VGRTLTKEEIFALDVDERMRLIEDLWDSIDPNHLPIPGSHRQLLDEALEEYRADPEEGRPWDEVRDELFPKE